MVNWMGMLLRWIDKEIFSTQDTGRIIYNMAKVANNSKILLRFKVIMCKGRSVDKVLNHLLMGIITKVNG